MTAAVHPAAPDHLPPFITAPGETDVLMVVTAVIVLLAVLGFGLVFLRIHTLPESQYRTQILGSSPSFWGSLCRLFGFFMSIGSAVARRRQRMS
jgi:hypothetical protein